MTVHPALNVREAAFVREFLICRNQTQAFIKAGYSAKTARVNAARMMTKHNIRAAIAEGETAAAERAKITLDDTVAQYTALAMTGMSRFVRIDAQGQPAIDLSRCTPADLDLLAEITVETFMDGKGRDAREVKRIKIKPYDRHQALDKLARFLGMFKEGQGEPPVDTLAELLKEIQARGTALPIKPQGPLGSNCAMPWMK